MDMLTNLFYLSMELAVNTGTVPTSGTTKFDFINNLGDAVIGVIQFIFVIMVSWIALKFLKDRAFTSLITFFAIALAVYLLIFYPQIFGEIGSSLTKVIRGE